MRKTRKEIAIDMLENSMSVDQDDLKKIKDRLGQERIEKLLKRLEE